MKNSSTQCVLTFVISAFMSISSLGQDTKINASSVKRNLSSEKAFISKMQPPTGAPIMPDDLFSTGNITWVNNLQDFVGRVVRINKTNGDVKIVNDILDDIKYDTVSVKTNFQLSFQNVIKKSFNANNIGEISFMGISLGANSKDEYSYEENTVAIATILPIKVDKSKIKPEFKCSGTNCEYAYINAAAVRLCEVRKFTERQKGGKIKPEELSGVLAKLSGLNGNVQFSKIQEDISKEYKIFFTVIRVPSN